MSGSRAAGDVAARGPFGRPLPVWVSFRNSALGRGLVPQVTNESAGVAIGGLTFEVTWVGPHPGRVARGLMAPHQPGHAAEVGWVELDGWRLAPGERVRLSAWVGGYDPLEVRVPSKAADR